MARGVFVGIASALALVVSGCDDGAMNTTPDAGPLPDDLEPLAAYEEQNVGGEAMFVPRALDYSCRGTRTRPTPGDPVETIFQLRDFQAGYPVDGADIWVFSNNVIADSCQAPSCTAITTDAAGDAALSLPAGGWFAYRVLPRMEADPLRTVSGVFQYNEPAPLTDGGTIVGNSVSGSTIDIIPATLGISRTEGLAIVAGRVEDCAEAYVENAIIRLFDPNGEAVTPSPSGPFFHYFNGNATNNVPAHGETDTNADGLYVVAEVPVISDGLYRVEAWGLLDGEPRLLGCEAARIFPDSVTILNVGPARADAPEGCPAP